MGVAAPLRAGPFYTGGDSTSDPAVPYRYPVSLNGRPYMLDTRMTDRWRHETVPLLRPQSDDSSQPGEASLNPDGLWRRPWSSWHKGSGQSHRDQEKSSPFRFADSRGVDPWTRNQLSLLPALDGKRTSSATNLKLVVCGSRLFLTDGADVVYTEDVTAGSPTWSATSGEPGGTILDIASDGRNVYITDGSNVYDAVGSASPPDFTTAWSTQDVDSLAFVKGRLVGGHDSALWTFASDGTATQISIAGVLPSTFVWVGFAGGPTNSVIYAAGFAGDKSLIFRIPIREDGTGLDVAVVAGELPDGEIVRAIDSYLGFVLIGTDRGVRLATADGAGTLTIGAEIATGSPCRCFEGQEEFVWFGWDDHTDPVSGDDWHGLGRFNLAEFSSVEDLAPSYAADLMIESDGVVSSVVTFQGVRVLCVEGTGLGVYGQDTVLVADGSVRFSDTDFGFAGNKTALYVDTTSSLPDDAEIGVRLTALGVDGPTQAVNGEIGDGSYTFGLDGVTGTDLRLALTLTRGAALGPTLASVVLRANPAVPSSRRISLPLMFEENLDPDGGVAYFDVDVERSAVEALWATRARVVLNEVGRVHNVVVEDFEWIPHLRGDAVNGFAVGGTLVVIAKET